MRRFETCAKALETLEQALKSGPGARYGLLAAQDEELDRASEDALY